MVKVRPLKFELKNEFQIDQKKKKFDTVNPDGNFCRFFKHEVSYSSYRECVSE